MVQPVYRTAETGTPVAVVISKRSRDFSAIKSLVGQHELENDAYIRDGTKMYELQGHIVQHSSRMMYRRRTTSRFNRVEGSPSRAEGAVRVLPRRLLQRWGEGN